MSKLLQGFVHAHVNAIFTTATFFPRRIPTIHTTPIYARNMISGPIYLFIYPTYLFIYLFSRPVVLFIYLFIYPIYLFIYLFIFETIHFIIAVQPLSETVM